MAAAAFTAAFTAVVVYAVSQWLKAWIVIRKSKENLLIYLDSGFPLSKIEILRN